jgi:ABC-type uncharacterized transport system auxiliary subunit
MKGQVKIFKISAAAILIGLLANACGKVRYPATYVLTFPRSTVQGQELKLRSGTVLVRDFRCPGYLCRGPIVFRPSPEEIGYYEYHRWAVSPGLQITQFMAESLQVQALFDQVRPYEKGIEAAYVLSGQIERLDEVDRGREVAVECVISAELADSHTGSVIWSDRASETLPVTQRNVKGVVNALTQASNNAVDNLVKSMVKNIAQVP